MYTLKFLRPFLIVNFLTFFVGLEILGQQIDPTRGVDPQVDYESLKRLGPWDDRNYQLTREELTLLAPNEAELSVHVPVFFKVELRKELPNLAISGPVQYPHSTYPLFLIRYRGFLVNGEYYSQFKKVNGEYVVIEDSGIVRQEERIHKSMFDSEVRVTSPEGAAESAVKVHPIDPDIVIAGSNGPGGGQKMHYSTDGSASWTQTTLPLGGTCCDPTVDWSYDGQYAYTSTLGNTLGVWFYRSDNQGQTWDGLESVTPGDPRREVFAGGGDKEYVHVDKYCSSPFRDNIYLTWHSGNIMYFASSSDYGNTWNTSNFPSDPRGIGSDIVTDHLGNIYYFYPAFSSRKIILLKSTDGGDNFAPASEIADTEASFIFPIPSMDVREVFIYVSADADLSGGPYHGSIYAAWTDSYSVTSGNPANNHARIQVAYSRDGGASWDITNPHPTADQNTVDRWHQWLSVARDGSVHVVFYDTQNSVDRSGVDFYHSFSTDGGQTFSVPERLTSETSPEFNDGFEFGDYNGMDHVQRVIGIFTDNRDESGGSGSSKDVYAVSELTDMSGNPMLPDQPGIIYGPSVTCSGIDNLQFSAEEVGNADSYHWTYSDGSATIEGNGTSSIILNGITTGGILSVVGRNDCGDSDPSEFNISLASEGTCAIISCTINSINIDDALLDQSDLFEAIETIDSDAQIMDDEIKIFRAGTQVTLQAPFGVEVGAIFLVSIDSCVEALQQSGKN